MPEPIRGKNFELTFLHVQQERFDAEKAKEFLTPSQVEACVVAINFVQIRTKRIGGKPSYPKEIELTGLSPEEVADMLGKVREQIRRLKKDEEAIKEFLNG